MSRRVGTTNDCNRAAVTAAGGIARSHFDSFQVEISFARGKGMSWATETRAGSTSFRYSVSMGQDAWRNEVALLLERCAASLRANRDRQAGADFGTAIAYLQRAEEDGELNAISLLAQARSVRSDDRTERFSFVPGELENLSGQGNTKE